MTKKTDEDYYIESKKFREEALRIADALKNRPIHFIITNVITMEVEITKSDLKTIVSKNTQDNRFNAFKNKIAHDLKGFLEKSVYEGWREVLPTNIQRLLISHILVVNSVKKPIYVFARSRILVYSNLMLLLTKRPLTLKFKI